MATHAGVKLSNQHREEIDKASEVTIICQASFWSRTRWIFLDAELQRRLKGVYLFDFILGHFALEFSKIKDKYNVKDDLGYPSGTAQINQSEFLQELS